MLEQDYLSNIVLFVKKQGHILTPNEIREEFYFNPNSSYYEFGRYYRDYEDDAAVIASFHKKAEFVFESVFDDNMVIDVLKKYMPENITNIYMSKMRCNRGSNFIVWQRYYGFTIEEFLTNTKYVVMADSRGNIMLLDEAGLLNHNEFEYITIDANGYDFKEDN